VKEVTVSGKSVDEALEEALKTLQVSQDEVDVEVLEEPKKGLLGFIGSKQAVIKVTVKVDPIHKAQDYLQAIIKKIGIDSEIAINKIGDRDYQFLITGEDLGLVIGKRGLTLNALQYLTNLVANQSSDANVRIELDAENYRVRRKTALEKLAQRTADRVRKTKKAVKLEPMPSHERKIVHMALQDVAEITTYSTGEEPNRAVVIDFKNKE
jgi:spoIIIJ-associated protein